VDFPSFVGGSYRSRSVNFDAQAMINFYVERAEVEGSKKADGLYPTPGLTDFCTLPKSPLRAVFDADVGRSFAIAGNGFYEIFANGTYTDRGTVVNTGLPATIDSNGSIGNQLFITSGDEGYCYDLVTNALTNPVHNCICGGFIGSFFIYLDGVQHAVFNSSANNGTVWNASHLFARNKAGDAWIAMKVINDLIWLMGPKTGEVWYNAGLSPVPFDPVPGGFFHVGTGSRYCIGDVADVPMWLGRTKDGHAQVYRGDGQRPQRVSTHAVEFALQSYASIADAVSYSYQEDGHTFYVLNFPGAGKTWVYDATTGLWGERGWWNQAAAQYECGRPQYSCFSFGKHLVGDRSSGKIYEMRVGLTTDADGALIRRLRRTPYVHGGPGRNLFFDKLTLDVQMGDGPLTGQGSAPLISTRWSDDYARTWSQERQMKVGRRGEYQFDCTTRKMGRSKTGSRTFEVVMTDPLPWLIVGADLDVRAGMH
jgi:hypothetical protein